MKPTHLLQSQLSERLKYLICSSFLLNPNLDPAFYNSHSTPPVPSEIKSFPDPTPYTTPNQTTNTNLVLSNQIQIQIFIFIEIFLFPLCYYYFLSLSSFLLSTIPILYLSFIYLNHHPPSTPITTPTEPRRPREIQFQIQSELIPQVTQLVNACQALDLRLSRAIGAVKEIECVALGFALSSPMPPISRLENATFPLESLPSPSRTDHPQRNTLHALGVRKVLQRVLDQLRHDFETTAAELETALVNPALNSSDTTSSTSSTLSALMEMYGCSRAHSTLESQSSIKNSATHRARRKAWRASLHSANQESSSGFSPNTSSNHLHHLNSPSSPSSPRRLSWKTPPPGTRSISETHHPIHSDVARRGSISLQQARSYASLSATPPLQSLEGGIKRFPSSSFEDSHHSGNYAPPRSRPVSIHLTAPTSPSSTRSPKPRPVSMYAASPYGPTSSSLFGPRKSIESYPNILVEPPNHPENTARTEEPPMSDRVIPYSLNALLNSFDRMNVSRKRLMCCLLALDFTLCIPSTSVNLWQDTLEAVGCLLKTVEDLSTELTNGMTSEFGPGSFENTPAVRPDSNTHTNAFQAPDHHHQYPDHQQEDRSVTEVRDFGPPIPESEKKARRYEELSNQMMVMDRALRTITAKMKVCMEELEKEEGGENHGRRAITIHDSIRVDLERLAREWDESRSKIRKVVEGEQVMIPGKSRLRNSLDSNEGSLSMSIGHGSSIYSSEILTPVSEDDSVGLFETGGGENGEEQEEEDDYEPIVSTIRSHQPMAAPPGLEEILKGVMMNETQVGSSNSNTSNSSSGNSQRRGIIETQSTSSTTSSTTLTRKSLKLTTEELHELRKKRRESIPITPRIQARSRPHSLLSLAPSSSSSSSSSSLLYPSSPPPNPNPNNANTHSLSSPSSASSPSSSSSNGVVTELKDVLLALKSKRISQQILT